MAYVNPAQGQLDALSKLPKDTPLSFLNLLKFKPDGGLEDFTHYSGATARLVYELGGKILYFGNCQMTMISDEEFDIMILVEYTSLKSYFGMIQNEEFQKTAPLRTKGVKDSRLFIMTEASVTETPGWDLAFGE